MTAVEDHYSASVLIDEVATIDEIVVKMTSLRAGAAPTALGVIQVTRISGSGGLFRFLRSPARILRVHFWQVNHY